MPRYFVAESHAGNLFDSLADAEQFIERKQSDGLVLSKVVSEPGKSEPQYLEMSPQEVEDYEREVEASKDAWAKTLNQD